MKSGISLIAVHKEFGTEEQCLAYLEAARWPEGVRCLVCGTDKVSKFKTNETERETTDDQGNVVKTARVPSRQLYQCNEETCRFQFSAKAGTIFDKSHLPLSTWFQAIAILVNAKKSVSAKQMERDLGVNYRTAWFLNHRIREAMQQPEGVFGGTVELDETFHGGKYNARGNRGRWKKQPIMGVLKRTTEDQPSQVRTFPIPNRGSEVITAVVRDYVSPLAKIYTDEWSSYRSMKKAYHHEIVIHSRGEYVRGDVHTNGIENFWSLVKRQIIGQHHFVSVKHLQRYLNECAFKFNNREAEDLFGMVVTNLVIGTALRYKALIGKS